MIRSLRPTLGAAVILRALAGALLGDSLAARIPTSGGAEQQRRRHQDELTFVVIDPPGATITTAYDINDRGQIVGVFLDAGT